MGQLHVHHLTVLQRYGCSGQIRLIVSPPTLVFDIAQPLHPCLPQICRKFAVSLLHVTAFTSTTKNHNPTVRCQLLVIQTDSDNSMCMSCILRLTDLVPLYKGTSLVDIGSDTTPTTLAVLGTGGQGASLILQACQATCI